MQNFFIHPNRRQAMTAFALASTPLAFAQTPSFADQTWQDARRQRSVPVRIRWPQGAPPAAGWPVVMYSHGLGGSREGGAVWGNAWAAAGLVVVHLQHAGSDINAARSVAGSFQDRAALRKLASGEQLVARLQDVVFALDEVARLKATDKAWRFVQTDAVGMAGHSFGAHTTLGVGGQSYPNRPAIQEPRIAALLALSPAVPAQGDVSLAFAGITRPTLCITGTRDSDVLGNGATPDRRAAVFDALPAGNKAMLLLKDADHMTFGGATGKAAGILPREAITSQLQLQHHALIASISTNWWRAHLMGNSGAKTRLHQPEGLDAGDIWQAG